MRLRRRSTASREAPSGVMPAEFAALVYELLDAHADTSTLAAGLARDDRWRAHLDYLRALQRSGREMLAHRSFQGFA